MSEESTDSMRQRMSRRTFLKFAGLAGLSAFLTACGVKSRKPEGLTPTPSRPSTPKKEAPLAETIIFQENGVTVWANAQGTPLRWVTNHGQEGFFDKTSLLNAQERVQAKHKIELASATRLAGTEKYPPPTNIASPERIVDLPEDVVSAEELAHRGIEVIASDNTALHIRKSAFEPNGVFAHHEPNSRLKLKIVITDSPSLTQEAFAASRYDHVRPAVNASLASIAELRDSTVTQQSGDPYYDELHAQIRSQITDEEAVHWGLYGPTGLATIDEVETADGKARCIFLPVTSPTTRPEAIGVLTVDATESGFRIYTDQLGPGALTGASRPLFLDPSQSYTPPEDYPLLEQYSEGTIEWKLLAAVDPDSKDPSFVVLHEATHNQQYSLLDSQNPQPEGRERLNYFSEHVADQLTRLTLANAYEAYQQTGDNSGYPFVLENKQEGYYVIG